MQTSTHTEAELDLILDGVQPVESDTQSTPEPLKLTRAIIVTSEHDSFDPKLFPSALAPIVDRPLVQHIVESLIRQGVSEFDVVLGAEPEKVEALLGDGSRWGTRIQFHLPGPAVTPCQIIRQVCGEEEAGIAFVSGERFYPVSKKQLAGQSGPTAVVLSEASGDRAGRWAGTAVVSAAELAGLAYARSTTELEESLLAVCESRGGTIEVEHTLDVSSGERLLETQRRVLNGEFPELTRHLGTPKNGAWNGRNSSLPSTAKITGPVFLGEHVSIGEHVEIGPNVVIGSGCVIDQGTTLQNTLALPRTSIGEKLELSDSIVAGRRLFNARLGAALQVPDEFLIGDLNEDIVLPSASRAFSRVSALLLLTVFSPVIALTWLLMRLGGPVVTRRSVVRLASQKAQDDPKTLNVISFRGRTGSSHSSMSSRAAWRHFLCEFLPGLIHVMRGELAVTGVTPSTEGEIAEMPDEWRQLYLNSQAGLVNESLVRSGTTEPGLERSIADAHYAVQDGHRNKLKLAGRYVVRLFLTNRRSKANRRHKTD